MGKWHLSATKCRRKPFFPQVLGSAHHAGRTKTAKPAQRPNWIELPYGGKRIVGIGANEANRAHDNHKNYSQHHRIVGDGLALYPLARVHAADRTYITSQAFVWTNGDDYESDERGRHTKYRWVTACVQKPESP